jgi:hypothetical protein
LPIIIQILLLFSLYKIFFINIESHAPFFGWIDNLAAPDPTNVFNLFGLIPFDPTMLPLIGSFLHVGAWPTVLGLTLWLLQRKISSSLLGSFQSLVYAILPILVAFLIANRPAGLVIYWAFFNILSIFHLLILMKTMKGVVGNISKYSAGVLRWGQIQPIVFLVMLAPVLQNFLMVLVFWRHETNGPGTETAQATRLRGDAQVNAEFPNALNDYFYRVEKDGTVSAVNGRGERVQFGDWRSFWEATHPPA